MIKSTLTDTVPLEIKETQRLLENPENAQTLQFIRDLAPKGKFIKNEIEVGIQLEKNELKTQFNDSFTHKEIKKECLKYNLACIKMRDFEGDLSFNFAKKIKDFIEEKKMTRGDQKALQETIYILAPQVCDAEGYKMKENVKDPLLFFNNGSYFILLDGDKSYVTLWNSFLGWKNYSEERVRLAYFIENFLLVVILSCMTFGYFSTISFLFGHWFLSLLSFGVLALAGMYIRMACRKSFKGKDFEHHEDFFNKDKRF